MNDTVLVDIAAALGSGSGPETADEVLHLLRAAIPYDAGAIAVWNPLLGRHTTLANAGYPDTVLNHFNTWFVDHDDAYHRMRYEDAPPLRWRDVGPTPYRESFTARTILIPAGYHEGVTTCLFGRGRRYTGSLHVSMADPARPLDADMPVLRYLQTMLAGLTDAMSGPRHLVDALCPSARAAVVRTDGAVIRLPGRDPGELLAESGALTSLVAAALAGGVLPGRFRGRDHAGGWHLVRTYPLDATAVLVAEVPETLPYEVTGREIEVLTLLAAGRSNREIATNLHLSTKTVAKHVEHLLGKLGCESRTGAAVRAVDAGLIRLPDAPATGVPVGASAAH